MIFGAIASVHQLSQLACWLLGYVYPMYKSVKALGTPKKEDDSKWLVYWMVFSLLSVVDIAQVFAKTITDYLPLVGKALHGIPFYYEVKLFIIFILLAGADKVIADKIVPTLVGYTGSLDKVDRVFINVLKNPLFDKIEGGITSLDAKSVERYFGDFQKYMLETIKNCKDPVKREQLVKALARGDVEAFVAKANEKPKPEPKKKGCCG